MTGRSEPARLRLALLGTRGVPAHYGGFETAAEEIGRRLVARGHVVAVYCRTGNTDQGALREHLGMRLVTMPALRVRSLETLSHTALATVHAARAGYDAVFLFNAANAVFLPVFRARRIPVAVHVDGIEWRRAKWSGAGKAYYRRAEALAVRRADALIADAPGIARYYAEEFGATTELLSYGAPILRRTPGDRLAEHGLRPGGYHLVVARFEPENHLELLVRGYRASSAHHPLVVVGGAPYSDDYTSLVHRAGADDPRIRFVGPVWDQDALDQLYAHALLYLHGHSVGGTNPSLLRAMGAGTAVCAYDVAFNRDVLGLDIPLFDDAAGVAAAVEHAEADPEGAAALGEMLRSRAEARFRWDDVADGYEALAHRLARGDTRRGEVDGRRRSARDAGSAPPAGERRAP